MHIKLGFAISNTTEKSEDLTRKIENALNISDEAIELSLTRDTKFNQPFTQETFDLLNKFKYKSIHAPVRDSNLNGINYPSKLGNTLLDIIDTIAKNINPTAILFHPDVVESFDYLNSRYGSTLAFENMDITKSFGKTLVELEEVFKKSPQAKWVFDINHIYTNDKSMKSAKEFYDAFKDRVTHYHVSSLGKAHDCFYNTHEDIILEGIQNLDMPMIHEGNAIDRGMGLEEFRYIEGYLQKKFRHGN